MNIKGFVKDTDDVEVSLSITMTLKEWKDLQTYLPQRYPHWKLGSAITNAIHKIGVGINEEIKVE